MLEKKYWKKKMNSVISNSIFSMKALCVLNEKTMILNELRNKFNWMYDSIDQNMIASRDNFLQIVISTSVQKTIRRFEIFDFLSDCSKSTNQLNFRQSIDSHTENIKSLQFFNLENMRQIFWADVFCFDFFMLTIVINEKFVKIYQKWTYILDLLRANFQNWRFDLFFIDASSVILHSFVFEFLAYTQEQMIVFFWVLKRSAWQNFEKKTWCEWASRC